MGIALSILFHLNKRMVKILKRISLSNILLQKSSISKVFSSITYFKDLKDCNLFIHRYSLVIYCVTCKKQIFDIYPQVSSPADNQLMQKEKLNPFIIREYFLKPINEEAMFYSNLEYPKSFQKEKRNCAILISLKKNTFLETLIRILAFVPTFNSMAQVVDPQKIKSPVLRLAFDLVKTMSSGQHRILKIHAFENVFFRQFPEFLSYENHKPITVLFKIFTEIEAEFKFSDTYCNPKQIISDERTEWGFGKYIGKYSPLREMLLSKFSNIEECYKCHNFRTENTLTKQFECLKLEPVTGGFPYFSNSLAKRKTIDLNIIKTIQATLEQEIPYLSETSQQYCESCTFETVHETKVIIEPGNYLLFEVESKENPKLIMPKQINLNELDSRKFLIDEACPIYEFVGGIYKDSEDRTVYPEEYGAVVYHNQNKKYLNFLERSSTEHETLLEKPYHILIYKRKPNQNNVPITKNIKSTLFLVDQNQLELQNPIPLPDFFPLYLAQHFKLPPLLNPFICHHGKINVKIEELTKCTKINFIPVEIYNFLVETFGGRKINQKSLNQPSKQCQLCLKGLETLNQLKTIQKSVMKYVDNFSVKKGQVLIYKQWLDQWKTYLYERSKQNYTQWGNPPSTQINNYLGMKDKNPKTIDYTKYSKISFEVWLALSMFHCGGPQLTIKKVVKNNSVKNYVQLRLEDAKPLYLELRKCLSSQTRKVLKIFGNTFALLEIKEGNDQEILSARGMEEDNLSKELKRRQKSQSKEKQRNRLFSREKSSSITRKL